MRCVRVVIADRHPVVLCGLMSLLGAENDFDVVASCYDGRKCIQAIREFSPDIALLDIFMPGLSGLEDSRCGNLRTPAYPCRLSHCPC